MSAVADGPATGMRHLALLYDTPEDLADSALPELRAAFDRGDDVTVLVDRRVARALRERLGPDADLARFPAPGDALAARGPGVVRELRGFVPHVPAVRAGGRALVVSQSDLFTGTEAELETIEGAVSRALADLPLTVLCCYSHRAVPCRTATACRVHPLLVTGDGVVPSSDFRAPDPDAFVPLAVEHTPTLWLAFGGTADLHRIRSGVSRVAADAGLWGDAADAAVLAVHETAVLACAARPDETDGDAHGDASRDAGGDPGAGPGGGPGDDCVLEVHMSPGSLTSEVHAPWGLAVAGAAHDPLAHIRPFCRSISLHGGHVVRVHVDSEGPPGLV